MDAPNGRDFYDQHGVFERYMNHRSWVENPNETIEKPVVLALLNARLEGPVLDLGCGFGDLAGEVLRRGADGYTGIDSSRKMIALAQTQGLPPEAVFIRADIHEWTYPEGRYHTVLARLVFHYTADLEGLLRNIHSSLRAGGELICSVEHPLLTSSFGVFRPEGKKGHWEVDRYFYSGSRLQDWLGGQVVKYHRTLEDYWQLFMTAGFTIEVLKEGKPERSAFRSEEEFERRNRIPLFLILKAVKR
ncbi:class I SAM-dependent DNA methyltransferase [Larkinella soli]|uniref:class I SAM-dependent DNA methyltransferase n=1 Tax=Larkinella soli TaxID=1770527 RepID=UPI000FFBEDA0|nr:class I SAM-dependent methyltransferase [Larkinella soli]